MDQIKKIVSSLIVGILLILPVRSLCQKYNVGLTLEPQIGFLIAHRATMGHLISHHAYGIEAGATIQTNGNKQWHHDFNFPEFNFSAFYDNPGNEIILGHSFGATGGVFLPFINEKGWKFGTKLGVGLAYVTQHYDLIENPKNNAIGSHLNCLVRIGFKVEKKLKQHAIGLNISMSHMSNGAVVLPNLGLNLPFLGINYTYFLKPVVKKDTASIHTVIYPVHTWRFYSLLIGSTKQIYPTGGNNFGILALANYVQFKAGNKCIIEGGIDAIYNQAITHYVDGNWRKDKNLQIGTYLAYVLPIHRFQLLVGMGAYIYNPLDPHGRWYHRLAGRFKIAKQLWGHLAIKSHWAKADYFEYGISYRW